MLLDGRNHADRSAWFPSDTPRAHSQCRRMRGCRLNTLGNLLCHPLVDPFTAWRSKRIERTINLTANSGSYAHLRISRPDLRRDCAPAPSTKSRTTLGRVASGAEWLRCVFGRWTSPYAPLRACSHSRMLHRVWRLRLARFTSPCRVLEHQPNLASDGFESQSSGSSIVATHR